MFLLLSALWRATHSLAFWAPADFTAWWRRPRERPRHTWIRQIEADSGLSASAAWDTADDRCRWKAQRSSWLCATDWLTEWINVSPPLFYRHSRQRILNAQLVCVATSRTQSQCCMDLPSAVEPILQTPFASTCRLYSSGVTNWLEALGQIT